MEKTTLGFNLFIDEDNYKAFATITNMARMHIEENEDVIFSNPDVVEMLKKTMPLAKEMSEKGHKMGWCKDVNCKHNKKNDEI